MRVLLAAPEKPQIDADPEILQRLIDESGMARFVSSHATHEVVHVGIAHPTLDLAVQDAARELGRHRADEKVEKLLVQVRRQRMDLGIK